jgi:L-lactate dehydrogenase
LSQLVPQKIAVVCVGAVGQACAFARMLRGSAREIVLVDRVAGCATAAATDLRYGAPLSPTVTLTTGDWSDLAGAASC